MQYAGGSVGVLTAMSPTQENVRHLSTGCCSSREGDSEMDMGEEKDEEVRGVPSWMGMRYVVKMHWCPKVRIST